MNIRNMHPVSYSSAGPVVLPYCTMAVLATPAALSLYRHTSFSTLHLLSRYWSRG